MNDLEERVRRGLGTDVDTIGTEDLLASVHRGVRRRRSRRTAGAAVAAVALVVAGVATAVRLGGDDGEPRPAPSPTSQTPTSDPTGDDPTLPPGASQGVIDVAVTTGEAWRLTTNVGCVGCSTVWLRDEDAEGGWQRLHDFAGKDPMFGPVSYVDMAENGRDGFAWGNRLHATHDGGRTWSVVTDGPGRTTDRGHWTFLTSTHAWSKFISDTSDGEELWRSELGSDAWQRVEVSGPVDDPRTIGDTVVMMTFAGEDTSSPVLRISRDGQTWSELALPCGGENQSHLGRSEVFVLCAAPAGATIHRSAGLAGWEEFGRSTLGQVTAGVALSDERLLVMGDGQAVLFEPGGSRPVDLGLPAGQDFYTATADVAGDTAYLTTSDNRILASTDGGLTWSGLD